MRDKARLAITGVVAAGALAAWAIGGHSVTFNMDDDESEAATSAEHDHGQKTTSSFANLKDFDGVTLAGPDDVVVTRAKEFSVKAEGDSRAIAHLKIYVENGMLYVGRENSTSWTGNHDRGATIRVALPALSHVSLTGPGDMSIDVMAAPKVKASVTGSGNLSIANIQADQADLSLTGSGDLVAAGHVKSADLGALGSGDMRAEKLETDTVSLKLVGSGDISVHARKSAEVSILGSGDAHVTGTNQCKISKMGSGEADCAS